MHNFLRKIVHMLKILEKWSLLNRKSTYYTPCKVAIRTYDFGKGNWKLLVCPPRSVKGQFVVKK